MTGKGLQVVAPGRRRPNGVASRSRYVSFTLRLSLNADNSVRYTDVRHVQSAQGEHQSGWDLAALAGFFSRHAEIQMPQPRVVAPWLHITAITIRPTAGRNTDGARVPRLDARISTELSAAPFLQARDRDNSCAVHLLAIEEDSNRMLILGSATGHMQPGEPDATFILEFAPPPVGRYQTVGLVLARYESLAGALPGPRLVIVPTPATTIAQPRLRGKR